MRRAEYAALVQQVEAGDADLTLLATEAEYQRAVLRWLDAGGWLHFHDWDSRGNKAGLPDLIATNGRVLLLAELKATGGRVKPEQKAWDEALQGVDRLVTGIYEPDRADELYRLILGRG